MKNRDRGRSKQGQGFFFATRESIKGSRMCDGTSSRRERTEEREKRKEANRGERGYKRRRLRLMEERENI